MGTGVLDGAPGVGAEDGGMVAVEVVFGGHRSDV